MDRQNASTKSGGKERESEREGDITFCFGDGKRGWGRSGGAKKDDDLCTMKPIHFYTMIDDMLAGILLISFFQK